MRGARPDADLEQVEGADGHDAIPTARTVYLYAARPTDPTCHPRPHADPALILFQRDDCHLCDLALDVLAQARAPEFESVFIDGDDALEARYGERVPVLRDEARGVELDWPFDVGRLQSLDALARSALR